ncbi:hypothetical protein BV898_03280 [Hypsibius exemplaris]|uniref:Uncharacterized protein n=1 Tax=Hypsibius exemplaris TaxID=2072580 RepID=A0A1W0X5I3_HYPEX|nr:hypothetical protein BV898_03280 [Hypsibius exemplaris]
MLPPRKHVPLRQDKYQESIQRGPKALPVAVEGQEGCCGPEGFCGNGPRGKVNAVVFYQTCAGIVNILNGAFMLSSQGSLVSGSLITAGIFMTLAAIALRIGFWDPEKGNFMVAGYGVLCCLSHVIIIGLIIYTFTQGLLDWKAMLRVVDVLLQLICIGFMLTLKGENLAQRSQSQPSEV